MRNIGIFATFLVLSVLSITYSGYALSVLWEWFIVSIFEIRSISIPSAIGLAIIVGYLTRDGEEPERESDFTAQLSRGVSKAFFKPSFALFVGWIVTFFM